VLRFRGKYLPFFSDMGTLLRDKYAIFLDAVSNADRFTENYIPCAIDMRQNERRNDGNPLTGTLARGQSVVLQGTETAVRLVRL
jgi:hypothetical protein